MLRKTLTIFGGLRPRPFDQLSLDPPFSLNKEIPQNSNVKSSRNLTVASEYRSHTQRIFVNFQSPHTSQCRTDTHRGYLKIFKSLHTTAQCPHTEIFEDSPNDGTFKLWVRKRQSLGGILYKSCCVQGGSKLRGKCCFWKISRNFAELHGHRNVSFEVMTTM